MAAHEEALQEGHGEIISGIKEGLLDRSFCIVRSWYPRASQCDGSLPRRPCVGDHASLGNRAGFPRREVVT